MSIRAQVTQELDNLNEVELKEIVEYMAFLKFRSRLKSLPAYNESQLAALYAEFADEDRQLAEEGMVDYTEGLTREDTL